MTVNPADFVRQAEALEAAALQATDPLVRDGYLKLAHTYRLMSVPTMIATIPDEEIERLAERMTGLPSKQ
jgi:hypothetical protein